MKLTMYPVAGFRVTSVTVKLSSVVCTFSEIENFPLRASELGLVIVIETDVGSPLVDDQVIWLEVPNTQYLSDDGPETVMAETIGAARRPSTVRATDFGEKNIVVACVLLRGEKRVIATRECG